MTHTELLTLTQSAGIEASVHSIDGCTQAEDGTYGPIVRSYYVDVVARDATRANTVTRRIWGPLAKMTPETIATTIAEIRAELVSRTKQMRARQRTERQMDAE